MDQGDHLAACANSRDFIWRKTRPRWFRRLVPTEWRAQWFELSLLRAKVDMREAARLAVRNRYDHPQTIAARNIAHPAGPVALRNGLSRPYPPETV
jgi:hypothetical protein